MAIMLDSGFEIVYCGRSDYEEMAVELWYHHEPVFEINREKGESLLEIRILNQSIFPERVKDHDFKLEDFLQAIEIAAKMLLECANTSDFMAEIFDHVNSVE